MLVEGAVPGARRKAALRVAAMFVVVTIATSLLLEAGWVALGDPRPLWARDVSYSVDVVRAGPSPFTVLVPTLVLPDGTPVDPFRGKTGHTGAVTNVRTVDTEHGPALSISGVGNVRFWAVGAPPSGAQEPGTYLTPHPGANVDLGMRAPDPPGWLPETTSGYHVSLGHAWIQVEGGAADPGARVVVSQTFPVQCASHSLVFDGNGTAGWATAEVVAQVGCPVA